MAIHDTRSKQREETSEAKRIRQAGLAAILGGVIGIVLSPLMTAAYHLTPQGATLPTPSWEPTLTSFAEPLLTFAAPVAVYDTYGMVALFTFVGVLAGVFGLRAHRGSMSSNKTIPRAERLERWGFRTAIAGLVLNLLGNIGDYWLGEPEVVDFVGFLVGTVLGLLVLAVGLALLGVGAWRTGSLSRVTVGLLVLWLPTTLVVMLVGLNNIPGEPLLTLGFVGVVLGQYLRSEMDDHNASVAPESNVNTE